MPTQRTDTQARLNTLTLCFAITVDTVEILANCLNASFLETIANTTRSLLKNIETVKKNKTTCVELMEQTHELLNTVIILHVKSETGRVLPPSVLNQIGKFTETLHKIHTFVESNQSSSKVKQFFRQGEMKTLLKDCKNGLAQGIDFFRVEAKQRHQEVLGMINGLSDTTSSDTASTMSRVYSQSQNRSLRLPSKLQFNPMLPSEPKIFHGHESELADILKLLSRDTPRIAILGTGGMGKTSLARAVLHHPEITAKYTLHRYFVACDSATSKVELAALIGAHLGLKPSRDLTQAIVKYFVIALPTLLILDNLETVWEPTELRHDIEEFLSLLTDIKDLSLIITMRGAERPAKVQWSHPFLLPLQPLKHHAAQQTFIDIAEDHHNPEDIDRVLSLTDNMPLAINLIAHLVDVEGCFSVLSRWAEEKTALMSEGCDRRSNLDVSISLSLSSPRFKTVPHAQELLSLLSMLPDGLSDVELLHSKLPIEDIRNCKATLIRTALAYVDDKKHLKALVPIREYMRKTHPPQNELVKYLSKYFYELFELYKDFSGTERNSAIVIQILSNLANIQSLLQNGLHKDHPDLTDNIFTALYLNLFSRITGRGPETLISQALKHFEYFDDPDLKCRPTLYTLDMNTDFSGFKSHFFQSHGILSPGYTVGNYIWKQKKTFPSTTQACMDEVDAWISADLSTEANAIRIEALAWLNLGNYKQSMCLCTRARELLALCDHLIMGTQAEIHLLKSEYHEAHNIQTQILQECPLSWDSYSHGYALLNLAGIGISINAPKDEVQINIERARKIFDNIRSVDNITACNAFLADLQLREGNIPTAYTLFSQWGASGQMSDWTTVYLAHSLKFKEKLGINKALQFLGDIFLAEANEDTAVSLFIVALEGFSLMDVHYSRAECMLRLGNISQGHSDVLKAVEYWDAARPLFERSSQNKQIELIDERLASVGEDVLERHRRNLAHLMEINAPTGIVEEAENELFDIEDCRKSGWSNGSEFW
ncbi:hypothetical protein DFH08DRAFT_823777 [Mycena albidolilacea]|uniref:Uncharacterized protein n=1 Tax=Mycena albidolilacea TaxID=1033008 RepID=A0AAD6Z5L0_9AGAR|nr:hypothetical protein DFH08DRAFT_823777 [Mycena albidolilacea]